MKPVFPLALSFVFNILLSTVIAQAKTAGVEATPPLKPLFTEAQIEQFQKSVKEQKTIPEKAVDIIFDFYKNNRKSVGGLKDASCIDKKEYRIRRQDPKLSKEILKTGIENESCLCVMDYTVSKTKQRGHCIFLAADKSPTIEHFLVAHGSGSGEKDGIPLKFTNRTTSTGTTLSGLHLTSTELYGFSGRAKGVGAYSSTGLGLYGVEEDNWTAAQVGKVSHGAPYVKDHPQHVGRSHGCPAMTMENCKKILPLCKGKAAWLNYTTATAAKAATTPQSCK